MPNFIKICPICFDQFLATRISQVYCLKKKCRNKARSYPAKVLQALLEKTSKATQVVETMPKVVKEYLQKHVKDGNLSLEESIRMSSTITQFDEHVILSDAVKLKQQREHELKMKSFEASSNEPSVKIDNEMASFKLPDIPLDIAMDDEVRDNLKFINKQDPLGNADGFGVGVVGSKEQGEEQKKEENK